LVVMTMDRSLLLPWVVAVIAGCATSAVSSQDAGTNTGDAGGACTPCVIDSDCAGNVCAQFAGDVFCAKPCPNGQSDCAGDTTCVGVSSVTGDPVNVCEPNGNLCGRSPDAGPSTCPGLASPTTPASCTSCATSAPNCQPNGCFGGWWCNTQSNKCQAPPNNCGSQDAGGVDAGGPITAKIGVNGGTESRLYFAIVGDTRPALPDQTSGYPTAIINKIFSDLTALSPMPPFVVATGDYQFASAFSGSEAVKQFALYTAASQSYRTAGGLEFPAMGNHECTGATASNCGMGNQYTSTNNFAAFKSALLAPIQKTEPYYVINVAADDSSWTAKFVFIAANAWDAAQSSWLDTTLSATTTYTFIIRHESASANTAPGVTPSEAIMSKHPYTLAIVGHTHTYYRPQVKEVIFGNGGAPLTSGNYGYGLVTQRADKSIQIDEIDMTTGNADPKFRFALHPDGTTSP